MTVSAQFLQLAALIASGIVVAAVIDAFRTMPIATKRWGSIIELIVWLLLGIGTYVLLFLLNKGQWRAIGPLAQISGMLLYQSLLQRPIRFVGRIIRIVCIKPLWLVIRGVISTISMFLRLIFKLVMFFITPFIKIYRKYNRRLFMRRK